VKTIGWLAGIGTMIAAAAYMVVSLNRWEWNRALFFGLIVLIAEVALATGLVLRKLGQMSRSGPPAADSEIAAALRESRPGDPPRFDWLRDSASGQFNVFITFLVGGGVFLSGVAWVVDRLASRTTSQIGERKLAERLNAISYPHGGLLAADGDGPLRTLLGPAGH
jgi:hypothetical protein